MIHLNNLSKIYTTSAKQHQALHGITLEISTGAFLSITGRSGSGKSTLLNLIAGLDRPSSGEIRINKSDLNQLSENQLAQWRALNVGVVFQSFQLLPTLTALENIMLPMILGPIPSRKARRKRSLALLEEVLLEEQSNSFPAQLSTGQQQRVAIARALANDPPLILADEPTGNLDSETGKLIFDLFDRIVDQGKTVVLITHDPNFAARATQQITLVDGKISLHQNHAISSVNLA